MNYDCKVFENQQQNQYFLTNLNNVFLILNSELSLIGFFRQKTSGSL